MSKKWQLNEADWSAAVRSAIIWLAPLGVLYFGAVIVNLQDLGFQWSDFALNDVTLGALVLYVVNQLFGLSRRLAAGR